MIAQWSAQGRGPPMGALAVILVLSKLEDGCHQRGLTGVDGRHCCISHRSAGMTSILLVLGLAFLTQEESGNEVRDRFLKTDLVVVHDTGIDDPTAESLADILAALITAMIEQFGPETPLLDVRFEADPHNHVLMTPDGKMLLRYENRNKLYPISLTNSSLSRTLGRALVRWHLLRGISTPFGLPDGMIEGFSHYIADECWFQAT